MTMRERVHRGMRRRPGAAAWLFILAATALGGCSAGDSIGPYIIDPGHYSVYHCNEFAPKLTALTTRERQLRNLMDKASDGGGGALIGSLSYRAEYEDVVGEEQVLRRTAAEKKCELPAPAATLQPAAVQPTAVQPPAAAAPPAYQSDQTIH